LVLLVVPVAYYNMCTCYFHTTNLHFLSTQNDPIVATIHISWGQNITKITIRPGLLAPDPARKAYLVALCGWRKREGREKQRERRNDWE